MKHFIFVALFLLFHHGSLLAQKVISPCGNQLLEAVQRLASGVKDTCTAGDYTTVNAFGAMSTACYGSIEKPGTVSFTTFYYLDSVSVRVIWANQLSTYTFYAACAPNPIVYEAHEGTQNHVYELRFLPVVAYNKFGGDKTSWASLKNLQTFKAGDIESITNIRLDAPNSTLAIKEKADYNNAFSSKGIRCTVKVKNQRTPIECYIYNNYDKAGTIQWKGPANTSLPTYPGLKVMNLKLPGANYAKDYYVEKRGDRYILNDDIIVGYDTPKPRTAGSANPEYRWPQAIIPVSIDGSIYTNNMQKTVQDALNRLNDSTEICFVLRTKEEDYVHIQMMPPLPPLPGIPSGISRPIAGESAVGRQGGKQFLNLTPGVKPGVVIHELLHAAGLYHEQERSDRNFYINVLEDNIGGGELGKAQFQIMPGETAGRYNYCSLVHYGQFAFSKDGISPTIQCKEFSPLPGATILKSCGCMGQRDSITALEIEGIDRLYSEVSKFPCKNKLVLDRNEQSEWRYCTKCQSLFYNGYAQKGLCSAGGNHTAQGYNFTLLYNTAVNSFAQKDWRFCDRCYNMFYDGYPDKGTCMGTPKEEIPGEHEADGFNFILTHDAPESASAQGAWRYCSKCSMMFYNGYATKGICTKGGEHTASGFNFVLVHDIPTNVAPFYLFQPSWRYCTKCAVLFYDGYPQKGTCATGGAHTAAGFNFAVPHDVGVTNNAQASWRYCRKCQGMFYDGYPQKGACPGAAKATKRGEHRAQGYNFVLMHDVPSVPAFNTFQSEWRFCSKCKSMFYNGYPQKGTCSAGGSHIAQGYNFSLTYNK